jgi:DNA-binding LacI/PurR family transcriptional regulator
VEELLSYRCAAVLALGSELTRAQLKALAGRAEVPTVLVGPGHRNTSYDVVHSDGQHGIAQAVEHLAGLGHRHLAYLHCPSLPSAVDGSAVSPAPPLAPDCTAPWSRCASSVTPKRRAAKPRAGC